jgi:predicted ATPase
MAPVARQRRPTFRRVRCCFVIAYAAERPVQPITDIKPARGEERVLERLERRQPAPGTGAGDMSVAGLDSTVRALRREVARVSRTNWYVITGGPSSGKTTTVNLLRARGYETTIEHARHYLDTQRVEGRTVAEIRSNQAAFQRGILDMQIAQEAMLDPDALVFLDRALPDALAYYRFLDLTPDPSLTEILPSVSYRKVFLLDLLPLVSDYARTEDSAAQKRIHELLGAVYEELGQTVETVPALPPEDRVDYILAHL